MDCGGQIGLLLMSWGHLMDFNGVIYLICDSLFAS